MKLAIVGLGNELLKDEGFGIKALRELSKNPPQDAHLIEGGTAGLSLLHLFFEYEILIFLDIIKVYDAPGSVYVFNMKAVGYKQSPVMSFHDIRIEDVYQKAVMLGSKAEAWVVGIVPKEINGVGEPTEALMAGMDKYLGEVRKLIRRCNAEEKNSDK